MENLPPIRLKRIVPQTVQLWKDEEYLGMVNEHEFNDMRVQIRTHGASGYWAFYEGQRILIYSNGRCSDWPEGFFDMWDKAIFQLL